VFRLRVFTIYQDHSHALAIVRGKLLCMGSLASEIFGIGARVLMKL